ncbi:MAG: response regulator [Candidatus Levybacteria bacterium]|nr:response regulator [Candidatus Levybacteria bacterium]
MKILIVEDDSFFQKFYTSKLTEQGFTTIVAADGKEALAAVEQEKPDLILLDIIMPNIDGFEVLSKLKKNEITKNIPVIVFSSLGQEQDVKKAIELGATGYVNKSFFDFDQLLAKIVSAKKT